METAEMIQIQTQLKDLEKLIRELSESKIVKPEVMQSEKTDELAKALSIAQGEFEVCYKNSKGPFGEFADLRSCLKAIKYAMKANGLSISQPIQDQDGGLFLYTIVRHSSDQFISSRIRMTPPADGDLRKLNSSAAYLKRMALSSLLGITGSNEDDDAELANFQIEEIFSAGTALKEQAKNKIGYENPGLMDTISADQLVELNRLLDGWPDICEDVKTKWGLRYLSDMPKSVFWEAADRIKKITIERKDEKLPKKG